LVFLAALALPLLALPALARDLTFEDRVAAQRAIARVSYAHQVGTTRPFEEAVPQALLEAKVEDDLRKSVALEDVWHTPVTAAALRAELDRIAAATRMPDRLREVFAALNDDPFLIQECYARHVLVDRLARDFYAFDATLHGMRRQEAESLRLRLQQGAVDPFAARPGRVVLEAQQVEDDRAPVGGELPAADRPMALSRRGYRAWRSSAAERVGEIGPVVEERDAFVIRVALSESGSAARVASFTIAKRSWDEWWAASRQHFGPERAGTVADAGAALPRRSGIGVVAASTPSCDAGNSWSDAGLAEVPDGAIGGTAVWTGTQLILWGGSVNLPLGEGGRYDPLTDSWSPLSTIGSPPTHRGHAAVWTGREMIVWGGVSDAVPGYPTAGGRYDPITDTWTTTSTTNAPAGRTGPTAVWTGSAMIVWGGQNGPAVNSGGRYDPGTDTWSATTLLGAPSARELHTAVWTGREMIVWGGSARGPFPPYLGTGGRYDPAADSWTPASTANAPPPRYWHTAVWTGSSMFVWGGTNSTSPYLDSGGLYDPLTDGWRPTSLTGVLGARQSPTSVWTGHEVIVWGGIQGSGAFARGARYDPANDSWLPVSENSAPTRRSGHVAAWTGSLMLVWGGGSNQGGRYDPIEDSWSPMSTGSGPSERSSHTAVWTGSEMVVWGGSGAQGDLDTGGRYDPVAATWTATSTLGAPAARDSHTAVWTGNEMVVWGGFARSLGGRTATGGAYDPIADAWRPTSSSGSPDPRYWHTAVWTGKEMIVWGGFVPGGYASTGGRYDPAADAWRSTSTSGAPAARLRHLAVWTGREMIVTSGNTPSEGGYGYSGGRYDPEADAWRPTSITSAPQGQDDSTAVWTGSEMIVWGGSQFADIWTFMGGRYDPLLDRWRPTSMTGKPSRRSAHSAVWTGSRMLIWGGGDSGTDFSNGAEYDPVADRWADITSSGAPSPRRYHTAVWTGDQMIVWGGGINFPLGSGGAYLPDALPDQDGDGYRICEGDCNDHDAAVHPGAAELCNGADDNCDGSTDEGFDLGASCEQPVDACHDLLGTMVCESDGAGTLCQGDTVPHDTAAPTLTLHASPSTLWPPKHQMVEVQLTWSVADACDAAPLVTLVSVTSSEPGDSDIAGADLGTADHSLSLRAERNGSGPGRIYRITFRATDASGNSTDTTVEVAVPRQSGKAPLVPRPEVLIPMPAPTAGRPFRPA
jgi:N-acetylneuraminic acid mutarotase